MVTDDSDTPVRRLRARAEIRYGRCDGVPVLCGTPPHRPGKDAAQDRCGTWPGPLSGTRGATRPRPAPDSGTPGPGSRVPCSTEAPSPPRLKIVGARVSRCAGKTPGVSWAIHSPERRKLRCAAASSPASLAAVTFSALIRLGLTEVGRGGQQVSVMRIPADRTPGHQCPSTVPLPVPQPDLADLRLGIQQRDRPGQPGRDPACSPPSCPRDTAGTGPGQLQALGDKP